MNRSFSVALVVLLSATLSGASRTIVPLPWPRAGVVVVGATSPAELDALGPVWYYSYSYAGDRLEGHQRVYLVPLRYDTVSLTDALEGAPRTWWIVGNEPNDPYQDNLSPAAYAAFYRRVAALVRRVQPTARLVTAGIANADPRWASEFVDAYRSQCGEGPPVDAWNVHCYMLEPDNDQLDVVLFRERITAFREWMATSGQGDKPLFLTEFGALYGHGPYGRPAESPERIADFVHESVTWLQSTEHVQCWSWFANKTAGQFNGDLYAPDGALSAYGRAYSEACFPSMN